MFVMCEKPLAFLVKSVPCRWDSREVHSNLVVYISTYRIQMVYYNDGPCWTFESSGC